MALLLLINSFQFNYSQSLIDITVTNTFNLIPLFYNICSDFPRNGEFAQMIQQKLDAYKADDNSMGQVGFEFILFNYITETNFNNNNNNNHPIFYLFYSTA